MVKRMGLVVGIIFVSSNIIFAQDDDAVGGIIYGDNWACLVKAPNGWVMDQKSLAHNNIFALFYEDGKKFDGNTPIIYITTNGLESSSDKELDAYINWDLENYKSDGMKIIKLNKKYTNLDKLKLTYRTYNLDIGNNQYETVIYTRYNDCVFLIILNTHDAKERDSLFEKLQEVINNMKPLDKNDQ